MSGPVPTGARLKILVVAPEPVSDPDRIAGTTIRALRLAQYLAPEFDITLTLPIGSADPSVPEVAAGPAWSAQSLATIAANYDVVVSQSNAFPARAWASPTGDNGMSRWPW